MPKLKPCPFCGSSNVYLFSHKATYWVQCYDCLCCTTQYERHEDIPSLDYDPAEKAVEVWNTRA